MTCFPPADSSITPFCGFISLYSVRHISWTTCSALQIHLHAAPVIHAACSDLSHVPVHATHGYFSCVYFFYSPVFSAHDQFSCLVNTDCMSLICISRADDTDFSVTIHQQGAVSIHQTGQVFCLQECLVVILKPLHNCRDQRRTFHCMTVLYP